MQRIVVVWVLLKAVEISRDCELLCSELDSLHCHFLSFFASKRREIVIVHMYQVNYSLQS